jgi:hypothetical protein
MSFSMGNCLQAFRRESSITLSLREPDTGGVSQGGFSAGGGEREACRRPANSERERDPGSWWRPQRALQYSWRADSSRHVWVANTRPPRKQRNFSRPVECTFMWELVRTVARSVVSAAKGRRKLALENLALRHQLAILRRQSKKPSLKDTDRSWGWDSGASGQNGSRRSSSCSRPQWRGGTGQDSAGIGDSRVARRADAPRSIRTYASSFATCGTRIQPGESRASRQNSASSASPSAIPPSLNTSRSDDIHRRRPGGAF